MATDDTDNEKIPSILACDCGNSSIKFAHVKGESVCEVRKLRLGELAAGLGAELLTIWEQMPKPKRVVACSVNPIALKAIEAAAAESLNEKILVVGRDLELPLDTAVEEPAKLGPDRVCAASAAFDRIGMACVVVDCGSAITVDCVDDAGVFRGGAILPGLAMSAKALTDGTAMLPHVELENPTWVFGCNTSQAIVGGVVCGARGAVRYFIEAYATQLGSWPVVIATGGDAELVFGDTTSGELVQAVVPDLTIRGVAMAYYRSLLK
ncbi:MAG TPA: type III pantothenate kinase [Phycisphaerae bacterium]|nr:type III pantothenate kinase [Phycisphaerae bacterium]HPS52989.1 type III pantothenate kinase [Phycisphaerae bacterium]